MTTAEYLLPGGWWGCAAERGTTASLHATNSRAVIDAVHDGHADVGFIEPFRGARPSHHGWWAPTGVLVANPHDPWARQRRILTTGTIAARPLTGEPGSGTRQVVEDAFRAASVTPPPADVGSTTAAILAAVKAGAPAFLSRLAVGPDLDSG